MKRNYFFTLLLIIGLGTLIGCCPTANGQSVAVDLDKLSPEVKAQITEQILDDAVTKRLKTYGKWAGMGKEIGIAAEGALTAVKDITLEVAESDLGKTIMFLVIWKVAGVEIIRIIIGLLIMIFITIVAGKSYFRSFNTRAVIEKSGFFLWKTKKYERINPNENWGNCSTNRSTAQIMHAIVWLGTVGIAYAIAFA